MELELKEMSKRKSLDGFTSCACGCGDAATLLVEIGLVGYVHGRFFDLSESNECLEKAFELCEERILSFNRPLEFFHDMRESA